MDELKENQLLLLCNLIYLNNVDTQQNETMKSTIDYLLGEDGLEDSRIIENDEKRTHIRYPCEMSREEWITVLKLIEQDEKLMKLTLVDGITDKMQARMACFVDEDNNATVVFRGTGGPMEWHDNGMGGYLSDTPQQETALRYVEGLTKKYNNITVTGHSKGGNKAQYVAIMCDEVDRCVSFDGQGFSREFFDAHPDEITRNSHKITRIADKWRGTLKKEYI